jgi:hypothetical protein
MEAMTTDTIALDPQVWDRAYARVERHLQAYRITNRFFLHQLTQEILTAAAARHESEPARDPADLAAEETERHLRAWIDELVGETDETPMRRFARGRAAVFFSDLPERWPVAFLGRNAPPPELGEQLRSTYLEAGPDFEFSSMVPRPIDLGPLSSVADETWRTFTKWPVLRGITLSALFVLTFGAAFYLVHF